MHRGRLLSSLVFLYHFFYVFNAGHVVRHDNIVVIHTNGKQFILYFICFFLFVFFSLVGQRHRRLTNVLITRVIHKSNFGSGDDLTMWSRVRLLTHTHSHTLTPSRTLFSVMYDRIFSGYCMIKFYLAKWHQNQITKTVKKGHSNHLFFELHVFGFIIF